MCILSEVTHQLPKLISFPVACPAQKLLSMREHEKLEVQLEVQQLGYVSSDEFEFDQVVRIKYE